MQRPGAVNQSPTPQGRGDGQNDQYTVQPQERRRFLFIHKLQDKRGRAMVSTEIAQAFFAGGEVGVLAWAGGGLGAGGGEDREALAPSSDVWRRMAVKR